MTQTFDKTFNVVSSESQNHAIISFKCQRLSKSYSGISLEEIGKIFVCFCNVFL